METLGTLVFYAAQGGHDCLNNSNVYDLCNFLMLQLRYLYFHVVNVILILNFWYMVVLVLVLVLQGQC